jgi:putative hydrolase of the HAD superfamily
MSAARAHVDAVLLDVDDTLVDTRAAFFAATRAVAGTWLPQLPADRRDEVALRWIADVGGHFRAFARGEITIAEQRRRRAADLQRTFGGAELDDEQFAAWYAVYDAAFRASWRLHEDAIALLDALDAAAVPYGALSNSSRELSVDKLARLGLADRLRLLVSPDDLGFGKPDPAVFRLACERLGSAPERTAYIGDELDHDAQAAQAAGLVGVWLDRRGGSPASVRPDGVLVVPVLADLPAVLDLAPHRR